MYSKILDNCKNGTCIQRLVYRNRDSGRDIVYGFPVIHNESCVSMLFDPWSGEWISESYRDYYFRSLSALRDQGKYVGMYEGDFDIDIEGPEELRGKEWLFKELEENKQLHSKERYCSSLEFSRYREKFDTTLIEIPNIRVVAVLNKVENGGWTNEQFESFEWRKRYQGLEEWEFEGWTALDYCPFCGAKLPERLDKKIIEVLKDEYGLETWEDYKKAPHEFHTDEWWRKRGL